jgi:hypothetical protein
LTHSRRAPPRSVRHPAHLVVLLLSVASTAAADIPEAAAPPTDIRREMLSEYTFRPPGSHAATQPPLPAAAPQSHSIWPAAADVVTMAPYTVRETSNTNALTASLTQEKAAAHTAMMMDKLGVGLHVLKVGKVALFAGTIFYIPFVVGGGFSW